MRCFTGIVFFEFHGYVFWTIHIMYAEHLLLNALIGIVVGLCAKEREMAATISLALLNDVLALQSVLMVTARARTVDVGYLWTLPWSFAFSFAVVVGGAIVRARRTRRLRGIRYY